MPTPFLIFVRTYVIGWMWLTFSTVEPMMDAIETELDRRGIDPEALA